MTNAELTTALRAARPGYPPGELCVLAAEEIERLAYELRIAKQELKISRGKELNFRTEGLKQWVIQDD